MRLYKFLRSIFVFLFLMAQPHYIEVLIPLRLSWIPCYSSPTSLARGTRVTVGFAGRRYSGVVWRNVPSPELDPSRIRPITAVNDELRPVSAEELRFWEFMASYYLCTPGEVFKAAFPAGKIRSEQTAAGILERLRQRLAIREEALTRKHRDNVRARLESERDAIAAQIAALTALPDDPSAPADHSTSAAPAASSANAVPTPSENRDGRSKNSPNCTYPLQQTGRWEQSASENQEGAGMKAGREAQSRPLLLVGPGRESIYLERCRETLAKGYNVLVLSPEIAASDQLTATFEEAFPGVVHKVNSHMTNTRRRAVAEDIRRFGGQLVTGTRSALFLPFSRLGLIIVENEQDILFKQTEPAPRYNARDAAVVLGRIHGAPVILGTPAPSLESLYNARTGKYAFQNTLTADTSRTTLIDIAAERRKNGMPGRLSFKLIEAVSHTTGPIALIRGWEKEDALREEAEKAFPGRQVDIYTLQEARLHELGGYGIIAIVQADALMNADDFRADERALQALAMLRENCRGALVIQTAKPGHPVFGDPVAVYDRLLEERKAFSLPPFTRLVDTVTGGTRERHTLTPDGSLQSRKQEIMDHATAAEKLSGGRVRTIIDVDPIS